MLALIIEWRNSTLMQLHGQKMVDLIKDDLTQAWIELGRTNKKSPKL